MARKAFSIHSDFYEELSNLNSTQRGDVMMALICWANDEVPPQLEPATAMLFRLMCAQIERISKANASNGAKGGRPSEQTEESEKSEKSRRNPKKPPVSVTDTVTNTATNTPLTPQGRGGAGSSPEPESFDLFWAAYPKKVGKGAAHTSWKKIKPGKAFLEKILDAVELAKRSEQWQCENGRYIPNPATWLNQKRWDDEPMPATGEVVASSHGRSYKVDGFAESAKQAIKEAGVYAPG